LKDRKGGSDGKGLALTIGLDAVDPKHHQGWSGELNACEADAIEMTAIGQSRNFVTKKLINREATRAKVIGEITEASIKSSPR
jgi:metacaspase-1